MEKAIAFAVKEHRGLSTDGPSPLPYATHPIEVMNIVRYVGGVTDESMLIAAALHDTAEHSGTSLEKIGRKFGKKVRELVGELTRTEPDVSGLGKMAARRVRFDALLAEVRAMSPEAQTIKLADRISNLRAAPVRKGAKLESYRAESRELLECIEESVNPALWQEAARLAA